MVERLRDRERAIHRNGKAEPQFSSNWENTVTTKCDGGGGTLYGFSKYEKDKWGPLSDSLVTGMRGVLGAHWKELVVSRLAEWVDRQKRKTRSI